MTQLDVSSIQPDNERLPRCCDEHRDWPTLAEHLLLDYPEINIADVVRQLRTARQAVEAVSLDDPEALQTAELIVRQQLSLQTGLVPDAARLDPERHNGRR